MSYDVVSLYPTYTAGLELRKCSRVDGSFEWIKQVLFFANIAVFSIPPEVFDLWNFSMRRLVVDGFRDGQGVSVFLDKFLCTTLQFV